MLKFAIKDIDKIAPVRVEEETGVQGSLGKLTMEKRENIPSTSLYSHFRNYAPPLDEKGGIITEKVFPVFSERVFRACFGLVI